MIKVIMVVLKSLGIGSIALQLVKKDVLMIPVENIGHGIKLILRRINVTCFPTKELLLMILPGYLVLNLAQEKTSQIMLMDALIKEVCYGIQKQLRNFNLSSMPFLFLMVTSIIWGTRITPESGEFITLEEISYQEYHSTLVSILLIL